MIGMMSEYAGYGYGSMILGSILNIVIIVVIVGAALMWLNRTGALGVDKERIAVIEKDVHDIKRMVEDIKGKLEEI